MKDPADKATIDAFETTKKRRGGKRAGAGMKQKYGEPTTTLRVPESRREGLESWLEALETLERMRREGADERDTKWIQAMLADAEKMFFDSVRMVKNLSNNG